MSTGSPPPARQGVVRLFEILEDEIRICLSLLGVTGYHELDKSYIRAGASGRAAACAQRLSPSQPTPRDLLGWGDAPAVRRRITPPPLSS